MAGGGTAGQSAYQQPAPQPQPQQQQQQSPPPPPSGSVQPRQQASRGGSRGNSAPTGIANSRQVFAMPECAMCNLTVYMDRALVCRHVKPRFTANEITEVVFDMISSAIDKNSIR
ncbi:unnamed protein product [Protopolystoma xenopodis]|uniref:Uncharacterized protein n=1 Tax=Protopolystoma xenopodis TaxID=117903 RepID=A0A448X957_9PLAT|nr:unnamed protein product [Protopolystoma xenopodis]